MPSKPHSSRRIRVEQLGRGVARHAVHVAVRRHHAGDPRPPHGRLEREQLLVAELARRRYGPGPGSGRLRPVRGRPCAWPWRSRHRRGRDPGAPRCTRSRAPRRGTGPRRTSPRSGPSAGRGAISRTGREGVPGAGQQHPPADRRGHRGDDVGIEARRGADRLLEARRGPGDQAVQAFLVDDRGDPEPRPLDQVALDRVRGLRPPRSAAGWSSPPAGVIWPMPSPARAASRASSNPVSGTTSNAQNEPELGDLLGARHAREQVGDARLDRERRIAVAGLDRRHQPFTDPAVRPPTMWRSAMR